MDKDTYINILMDSLVKKESLIDELIILTRLQSEIFETMPLDLEKLDDSLSEKEIKIEQLNQLDDGFEKVFLHIKDELSTNRLENKEQIIKLQELISGVVEKSTKLEIMEKKNKNQFSIAFMHKRKEIGKSKVSNNVVSNYYKNMSNQVQGQSYFLDKKK